MSCSRNSFILGVFIFLLENPGMHLSYVKSFEDIRVVADEWDGATKLG